MFTFYTYTVSKNIILLLVKRTLNKLSSHVPWDIGISSAAANKDNDTLHKVA